MKGKPTTAQLIIMIAGAVTLVFSFLAFYKVDIGNDTEGFSAWNGDEAGLFPVATLPAIFGLVMAGVLALQIFAGVNLPARILDFTWKQIHLALGFFATLLMLAFLIKEKGGLDFGFGFFMMLLGSIGLLVGAFMYHKEPDTAAAAGPGATPPTPF